MKVFETIGRLVIVLAVVAVVWTAVLAVGASLLVSSHSDGSICGFPVSGLREIPAAKGIYIYLHDVKEAKVYVNHLRARYEPSKHAWSASVAKQPWRIEVWSGHTQCHLTGTSHPNARIDVRVEGRH